MAKLIINTDAARAVIKSGTIPIARSIQNFPQVSDVAVVERNDIRLALLKSAWSANNAGLYSATACFIMNDVADTSFIFPVVAPTVTSAPSGEVNSAKFYVIWRGRWEVIGGLGGNGGDDDPPELITRSGTALTSLTTSQNSFLTSATINALASAELSASSDASSGRIPYVESISCVDGELTVTIKYLSLTTTSANLLTTTGAALTEVSTASGTFLTDAELQ